MILKQWDPASGAPSAVLMVATAEAIRDPQPLCTADVQVSSLNKATQASRSRLALTKGCNLATHCWRSR